MKRRHLLDFEIYGSVCAWEFSIDISRNEKTGLWCLYLTGSHSDHPCSESSAGNDAESIRDWLDEKDCSIDEFCVALRRQDEPACGSLAAELEALSQRDA